MQTTPTLFERVLVPVASQQDAQATARAVLPYLRDDGGRAIVVHVVEKGGGALDKASVEQREQATAEIFEAFGDALSDSEVEYETEIRYGTDVAETILAAGDDLDASAIAFTPRGGSRWVHLLTGDVGHTLVEGADRPVVVLPDVEDADVAAVEGESSAEGDETGDDSDEEESE